MTIYTDQSPLLGAPATIVPTRIAGAICARPHGAYTDHDVTTIVWAYVNQAAVLGLDPVLAIAQMIHETGNLASFWAARPQRNPAGIGVNGDAMRFTDANPNPREWAYNTERQQWERGVSFATWVQDAIPAHLGRLLAYALPLDQGTGVQRQAIARALTYRPLPDRMRGSAPRLRQLGRVHNPTGQGWASPGLAYGARIAAVANHLRSLT
jgi:hypothetical protein